METQKVDIQLTVHDSLIEIYDRYVEQAMGYDKIMSFEDFFNQMLIRGMLEYSKQLTDLERSLK